MQEMAPYGVFATDGDLRIRSWNEWLARHSKRRAADVVGRPLTEAFPELDQRRLLEHYRRALAGEVSVLSTALHKYLLPIMVEHRDGQPLPMFQTARIAPLRAGEEVVGTITVIEDVTQRELQSKILQRQQELDRLLSHTLGTLLQSNDPPRDIPDIFPTLTTPLGVDAYFYYLLDADQRNLRLIAAGGIAPRQKQAIAFVPVAARPRSEGTVPDTAMQESIATHVAAVKSLGLRSQCCFPLTIGERALGLLSFGCYEQERIDDETHTMLARVARYVAISLDRGLRQLELQSASKAKDDFLAALSHELRAPLNPVLLVASDAAHNPAHPPEVRELFAFIEKNALLEARLIDDLLDLTRIEHDKMTLETQPTDMHDIVRDSIVTVQPDIEERRLSLEVKLGARHSIVEGDAVRLRQICWNVLKNAVKFTPPGGSITVASRLDEPGTQVLIQITDTGVGMDPHELERVFVAFSQGDHASGGAHRFGGLGLGLAITRKLVELHGGRIEAASGGKGQGATFTIVLPVKVQAEEPSAPVALPSTESSVTRSEPSRATRRRILLVEDHEATRAPLERLLTRRGFEVVSVASVAEAREQANATPFDLVLSDIGLPDGDGYELMASLRDDHGLRGLALTGYGMEEDVARSYASGFLTHLTKPIRFGALDRALEAAFADEDATHDAAEQSSGRA